MKMVDMPLNKGKLINQLVSLNKDFIVFDNQIQKFEHLLNQEN